MCHRTIPFVGYICTENSQSKSHRKFYPTKEHRAFCVWSSNNQTRISQFWAQFSEGEIPVSVQSTSNYNLDSTLNQIRKTLKMKF